MKKESRKGTFRAAGHIWHSTPCNPTDGWTTNLNERIRLTTWQFGSIHQCVLNISYNDDDVHIGLEPNKTVQEAMAHLVQFGINLIEKGFSQSVEQVFQDCYAHWPSLYRTRLDIINHIFFTIGNGYEWLDGSIICAGPEDHIGARERDEYRRKNPDQSTLKSIALFKAIVEDPESSEETKKIAERGLSLYDNETETDFTRPLPDDGQPRAFYPVCDSSNICNVPNDVKPDWLALAYEAVILLRDRSGISDEVRRNYSEQYIKDDEQRNTRNIKAASKILVEFRERFPEFMKDKPKDKTSFNVLWSMAVSRKDIERNQTGEQNYDQWQAILKEHGWTHREWYEAVSDFRGFKRPE